MSIISNIRRFLEMDRFVSERRKKETMKTQRIIALISALGFLLFSFINIHQDSDVMLISTIVASVVFFIAFGLSYAVKDAYPIRLAFYLILLFLLPIYILAAGNEGFAALWIVLVTYLMMYTIDFRVGFVISFCYFIFLIFAFLTPLFDPLFFGSAKDAYNGEFLQRFPFYFLINFSFATYIIGSIRVYQYHSLMHQKELEDLSHRDLNTDLYNRNAYINLCEKNIVKEGQPVAVVYMDANGLHELNNTKGHAEGDKMLRTVATVAKDVFGKENCFRVGGDEFVACVLDISEEEITKKADLAVQAVKARGYSVSAGICWTDTKRDLVEISVEANTRMLANKAAFYSRAENSRRKRDTSES